MSIISIKHFQKVCGVNNFVSTVQHKEQAAPENVGRKTHKSRQKIDARGNRMGVLGFKH